MIPRGTEGQSQALSKVFQGFSKGLSTRSVKLCLGLLSVLDD